MIRKNSVFDDLERVFEDSWDFEPVFKDKEKLFSKLFDKIDKSLGTKTCIDITNGKGTCRVTEKGADGKEKILHEYDVDFTKDKPSIIETTGMLGCEDDTHDASTIDGTCAHDAVKDFNNKKTYCVKRVSDDRCECTEPCTVDLTDALDELERQLHADEAKSEPTDCCKKCHEKLSPHGLDDGPVPYECVDHPKHYNQYPIEAIDVIEKVYGSYLASKWCEITAFKYRLRMGNKPGNTAQQDLDKEKWYLAKSDELLDKYVQKKRDGKRAF